jgi:hypothetical protein
VSVPEVQEGYCQMPRSTRSTEGSERHRLQIFPGDPCPWPAVRVRGGVALCWVHYQAVIAGTRELREARVRMAP